MKFFKKVSALTSASAMTGLVVFAGAVGVANAAPVTLVIEPEFLAPGGTATILIDGCAVGSSLTLSINGAEDFTEVVEKMPYTIDVTYELAEGFEFGTNDVAVSCASAETTTSANDSLTLFGRDYVEAIPDTFYAGDTISITAGDFLPGDAVTLEVLADDSEDVVYFKGLGTAKADFSVTGDVAFPKDLECGEYDVVITGGEYSSSAGLYICGKPTPEPSASPSASASPSVSPSASPSVSPSASAQPSATTSPTRPVNPGLPSTGN